MRLVIALQVALYPPPPPMHQEMQKYVPQPYLETEPMPVENVPGRCNVTATAVAGTSHLSGYWESETGAMGRSLLHDGVLEANGGMTTISEIRGFVRGRMR